MSNHHSHIQEQKSGVLTSIFHDTMRSLVVCFISPFSVMRALLSTVHQHEAREGVAHIITHRGSLWYSEQKEKKIDKLGV